MSSIDFPIMGHTRAHTLGYDAFTIPWAMLAPHEPQAMRNHCGQSLQRLAERGGLSPCEALAVLDDRRWKQMDLMGAMHELRRRAAEFEQEIPS